MSDCVVNVMMFGGRRCGKTSVIAAMKNCFEKMFGENDDLYVHITDDYTTAAIEEKNREISNYFVGSKKGIAMDSTSSQTTEMLDYRLDISIKNKKGSVTMNLCDYPGEWLKFDKKDKWAVLADKMKTCNVIMIAIDTVYLMEKSHSNDPDSVGEFNERRNYCQRIANMVKNNFTVSDSEEPKLIMFVPLKCEKYFRKGQMDIVNRKIHIAYQELFSFIGGTNRKNYEVVISPILTLGRNAFEFGRFERDSNNELYMDKEMNIPSRPVFTYKSTAPKYEPEYCEQPLLYTLAYLLDQMNKIKTAEKEKAGILKKLLMIFAEKFGNIATAEDFFTHRIRIMNKLKTSGDGFEVWSDPLKFT